MHPKYTTRSLIVMALFASLLCICAYLTIPLPMGQHITLQNFLVLLIAFVFPLNQSFLILLIWLLLGIVGIPVFTGGNGLSYLCSPLGGYNISFILIAVIIPLLRGKTYQRHYYTILAVLAAFAIDVFGAGWLMLLNELSVKQAFLIGVLPYLPLDIIKAVAVAQVVPQFKRIIF